MSSPVVVGGECGSSHAHMCEIGGDAWGGRPPRRRGVRGAAIRPLATRWATVAGSELLAKRDAASLRRARQQATSSRAPAVSTHATPTLPSETSSVHLWRAVAGCHAYITAVSGVSRQAVVSGGSITRTRVPALRQAGAHAERAIVPAALRRRRFFRRRRLSHISGGANKTPGVKATEPEPESKVTGKEEEEEVHGGGSSICFKSSMFFKRSQHEHVLNKRPKLDRTNIGRVAHEAAVSKHAPTHCVHWHHGHTSKYCAHGRTMRFFLGRQGALTLGKSCPGPSLGRFRRGSLAAPVGVGGRDWSCRNR